MTNNGARNVTPSALFNQIRSAITQVSVTTLARQMCVKKGALLQKDLAQAIAAMTRWCSHRHHYMCGSSRAFGLMDLLMLIEAMLKLKQSS